MQYERAKKQNFMLISKPLKKLRQRLMQKVVKVRKVLRTVINLEN